MFVAACSPTSSIFSEMLEINAQRCASKRDSYDDSINFDINSYNAANSSPVFFGRYGHRLGDTETINDGEDSGGSARSSYLPDYDPATTHPATFGYVLLNKKPPIKKEEPVLPDPKLCSPRDYLEAYIFPVLLPAIEKMIQAAKENKVFERRRTKFNACDFLTEYLYKNNPKYDDREDAELLQIPFVQKILEKNPRPPLPLSLLLSDDEAATIIQSFYRGYCVRKTPEVQELREYQKEMRNEAVDIFLKIEDFWRKHPVDETIEDDTELPLTESTEETETEATTPQ